MRRHEVDLPEPRGAVEDIDRVTPDVERASTWVVPGSRKPAERGPKTPAERVAARRRLDRLAEE